MVSYLLSSFGAGSLHVTPAHVRQATHRTGHKAACKILPALHPPGGKMVTWDQTMDAIEAYKEVVLLKALAGAGIPGIVGLEGVIEEGGWTWVPSSQLLSQSPEGKTDRRCVLSFIFLTLYENSASSIVSPCSRSLLVPFFRRLLKTIQAIHSIDLSHEDIKRSNILLDNAGRPVLVDFGFSHLKADGGHVKSAGGTLDYSSPEKVIVSACLNEKGSSCRKETDTIQRRTMFGHSGSCSFDSSASRIHLSGETRPRKLFICNRLSAKESRRSSSMTSLSFAGHLRSSKMVDWQVLSKECLTRIRSHEQR